MTDKDDGATSPTQAALSSSSPRRDHRGPSVDIAFDDELDLGELFQDDYEHHDDVEVDLRSDGASENGEGGEDGPPSAQRRAPTPGFVSERLDDDGGNVPRDFSLEPQDNNGHSLDVDHDQEKSEEEGVDASREEGKDDDDEDRKSTTTRDPLSHLFVYDPQTELARWDAARAVHEMKLAQQRDDQEANALLKELDEVTREIGIWAASRLERTDEDHVHALRGLQEEMATKEAQQESERSKMLGFLTSIKTAMAKLV